MRLPHSNVGWSPHHTEVSRPAEGGEVVQAEVRTSPPRFFLIGKCAAARMRGRVALDLTNLQRNRSQFWSAATCRRFGITRFVAAVLFVPSRVATSREHMKAATGRRTPKFCPERTARAKTDLRFTCS
jgi:hypothetical protein